MAGKNAEKPDTEKPEEKGAELPITIELITPFKVGDSQHEYREIVLQYRLKTKHTRHLNGKWDPRDWTVEDYIPMVQGLTGLPMAVIDEMDPRDTRQIQEVILHFLQ